MDIKRRQTYIERRAKSAAHKEKTEALQRQPKLSFKPQTQAQVTRAEVKVTNFLVQHNIPLAAADHFGPLVRDIFPDSEIAKSYRSARTKTTCIPNGALMPHYKEQLVGRMQKEPFALATDGSSDNGIQKMNPLTVRFFDINKHRVTTELLHMCLTTGKNAGTEETIFSKVDEVLSSHKVPWKNCFGVAMDNASVNMGRHNSMKTRILAQNGAIYIMGCPCHIVHNTADNASQAFAATSGFDAEDFSVDLFYWFDKSTQRKSVLADYYEFCDVEYRSIIKQVNTRWLSLETAVNRNLQQYDGLRSYFLSEHASQARFRHSTAISFARAQIHVRGRAPKILYKPRALPRLLPA